MEDDFVFPDRPADLCDPRCELPLRCAELVDVAGLEREDLDEFVDRTEFFVFAVSVSSASSAACFRPSRHPKKRALVFFSAQSDSMCSLGTSDAKNLLSFALLCEAIASFLSSLSLSFLTFRRRRRSTLSVETIKKKQARSTTCATPTPSPCSSRRLSTASFLSCGELD